MRSGVKLHKLLLSRAGSGEQVPAVVLIPEETNGAFVVWVHPRGKASLYENGKLVYSVKRSFTTTANLTGSYSRTYTFNGVTYIVAANVSCSR